jgi:tRNA (cytidine/uridine-2'-O-)-methyltransferase
MPMCVIPSLVKTSPPLHIVLHQPEIPQNAGNIGRTCVAMGAKLWLVQPLGFRLDDHHVKRAGLDYWQYLDWEVVPDWEHLQQRLDPAPMWYFTKHATRHYTQAAFQPGCVLVFGSETQGLPAAMLSGAGDSALRIPIRDEVRSLNLATTVGIASYEALRQMT